MDSAGVARRIKLVRKGRGWTQGELGMKLGRYKDEESAANAVKSIETGRGSSSEMIQAIAAALDVSFAYLITGDARESDLEVIVEGARQDGWDEAVDRMRDSLLSLERVAKTTRRRARVSRPDEDEHRPNPATQPKKRPA